MTNFLNSLRSQAMVYLFEDLRAVATGKSFTCSSYV